MSVQGNFPAAVFWLAALASSCSLAHSPYLVPATFEPSRQGWVTLDASFADAFFVPEVVFDNSEFRIVNPQGQPERPAELHLLRTRAVLEHRLQEKGTYRFSTGVRHGAVFRAYEVAGERKATRDPDEVLPAGARLLDHFQSVTLAETYLTLGAPSPAALKPYGEGLEVVAATHPSDLYEGEAFRVQVLFDGKPLPAQPVQVFSGQGGGGQQKPVLETRTDPRGFADLRLPRATYLLQTRHRHAAPQGAAAPSYSHTYTLVFEVVEQ